MDKFDAGLLQRLGMTEDDGDSLEEQKSLRHENKKRDIGNWTWALQPSCCWRSGVEWLLV